MCNNHTMIEPNARGNQSAINMYKTKPHIGTLKGYTCNAVKELFSLRQRKQKHTSTATSVE